MEIQITASANVTVNVEVEMDEEGIVFLLGQEIGSVLKVGEKFIPCVEGSPSGYSVSEVEAAIESLVAQAVTNGKPLNVPSFEVTLKWPSYIAKPNPFDIDKF